MRSLLTLLSLTLALLPKISAYSDPRKCYLMDGTSAPSLSPCLPPPTDSSSDTTTHSPCCALRNSTTNPVVCLEPSGLCLSRNGLLYESGCTDPTWSDSACPFICPDQRSQWKGKAQEGKEWKQGQEVQHWQVMTCSPNSVCCRRFSGDTGCCGNRSLRVDEFEVGMPRFRVWEGEGVDGSVLSQNGSSSSNSSGDGNGNGTTCGSANGESDGDGGCEECREATVGAAVGAPLGAAFVATLAALAWAIRKQKVTEKRLHGVEAQAQAHAQAQMQGPGSVVSSPGYYKEDGVRQVQRPGNHAELSAMRQYELDGRPNA